MLSILNSKSNNRKIHRPFTYAQNLEESIPTVKHGGGSVMLWLSFPAVGTGKLIRDEGKINNNLLHSTFLCFKRQNKYNTLKINSCNLPLKYFMSHLYLFHTYLYSVHFRATMYPNTQSATGQMCSLTSMKSALAGMYPAMSRDSTESNVGRGGSSLAVASQKI